MHASTATNQCAADSNACRQRPNGDETSGLGKETMSIF
jgi:hypothetical protein